MKALNFSLNLLVCGLLLGTAASCTVDFPDELPYTCAQDGDCGGNGYVCTSLPDGRRYCCSPTEAEVCNRLDDDCDGQVDELESSTCYSGPEATRNVGTCRVGKPSCGDGNIVCTGEVLPTTEVCNGKDDDCDTEVDEGFDFLTGRNNCGRCDQACTDVQDCVGGQCVRRRETACDNTTDDDLDGQSDCADTDCNALPCGVNCICIGGKKGEAVCNNNVDDDGDSTGTTNLTDCADPDCDAKVCGAGCVCIGGAKGEGECGNGVDDDGDGATRIDCADSDCANKECGEGCLCVGTSKTEVLCGNKLDDDKDGNGTTLIDCADPDCTGKECGVGCLCQGSAKVEAACSDGMDNDDDGLIDCEDSQCDGQSCVLGEAGAICKRRQCLENNCTDTLDNDKNGKTDCMDPGCEGMNHIQPRQVCTVANGPQEVNCTNNQDDDGDSRIDCRTSGQGSEPNCLNGSCGVGCQNNNTPGSACTAKVETYCDDNVNNDAEGGTDCGDPDCEGKSCSGLGGCTCTGGARKEVTCNDRKDNDADNLIDCADTTDCPAATPCRKADNTAGVCGAGNQCV
jgi:hypothetical protein